MSPAGLAATLTATETAESLRYRVPAHISYLSGLIVKAVAGVIPQRLMVFAPPRHGKSELVSRWTPVWFLNNFPERRVMFATYSAEFASDWGRKVRNTVNQYESEISLRLAEDSQATNRWHTTHGGGMVAQGVGGAFTGRGAELAICDDPFKNSEEANSAVHRNKVWEWWGSTFMTRLEPGAVVILTMTRWHTDDLAGRILADPEQAAQWHVVSLPAIADGSDPIGRKAGEALWPDRMPVAALEDRKIAVGSYVWSALYQQTPPNLDGGNVYHQFKFSDWPTGNIDRTVGVVAELPLDLSIDFNKRPGSHAIVGQYFKNDDTITAIKELFTPAGVAKHIATAFVDWWKATKPNVPYVNLYGDASGGSGVLTDGRTAWDAVTSELRAANIPFKLRVPSRNPGVHNRVEAVNNALCNARGERRYRIHPDCRKLITDLQKVTWDGDDIDKRSNVELTHASDADGYRVFSVIPLRERSYSLLHVATA